MIRTTRALCVGAIVLAVVAAIATIPEGPWRSSANVVVGAASGVAVAGLAGLVALAATTSWREQRDRDVDAEHRAKRAETYVNLIADLVRSFTSGAKSELALQRSTLALWGSPETLDAFGAWNAFTTKTGSGYLDAERRIEARDLIGAAVVAARKDLGATESVTVDAVVRVLFNDHDVHDLRISPPKVHQEPQPWR